MVSEKCQKKLSKVIVPDKWMERASNTTEGGGRKINENKLLSKKNRGKKRKIDREIFRSCSRQRQELNTEDEEVTKDVEEGSTEMVQSTRNQMKTEDDVYNLPELPAAPAIQKNKPGVIFILEMASLVPAYVGKTYQILNPDKHAEFLRRKHKDPYRYRPDIVHKALLRIMKSRLCMAGQVEAIYIKTDEGVLIKVSPCACIPNSLERFCAMMSELLQKLSIKAKGKGEKLLRVIANPVTQHLPVNSLKIGLSFSSQKAVQLGDYVSAVRDDATLVFVVGAMARGKIDSSYTDDFIQVSGFPLSAEACVRLICDALETKRKIW